jgi:phage terminase large subunit
MSEALYERRYCGKFTQLEGLVYAVKPEDLIDPFKIPEDWKRFGGMDFGKSDPTAILDVAEDPVKHIFYVTAEFYKNNGSLKEWAEWIGSRPMQRILADPQSAQLISELRTAHGLGQVQPADKQEIMVGIERLQALFNEGRLKIFSNCKNLIEELSIYCFAAPDPDKVQRDMPVDKNNHAMDALRYAFNKPMEGLYLNRQAEIKQKRSRYTPLVTRTNWLAGINPRTGY